MPRLESHRRTPRATVPARFRWESPAQRRGHETLERFAEATEELLRERSFEDIGVQDIVRRARRPIGSFYARFASKEALLPLLYQRYHDGLEAQVATHVARVPWAELDLARTVDAFVELVIAVYTERPWLIRALALFARTRPEGLPHDLVEQRRAVYAPLFAALLRHRPHIAHADPEAAVRFAVFLALSVAREK